MPAEPDVTVNKRELARILDVSLPTLDAAIGRHGEAFPVLSRGSNGVEWAFDPVAVLRFYAELREREAADEAAHARQIEALGLPLAGPLAPQPGNVDPKVVLNHVRALRAQDDLAISRGFLVQTADVRKLLVSAIVRWNRNELAALRQAGKSMNIPDPALRAMEASIATARGEFLRELRTLLTDEPGADDGLLRGLG